MQTLTAFALCGFLMLYTLPSGVILLLPLGVFLFLYDRWGESGQWVELHYGCLWAGMMAAVAYLPLLRSLVAFSHGQQTALVQTDVRAFLAELGSEAAAGILSGPQLAVLLVVGFWLIHPYYRRCFGIILFAYLAIALILHPWAPFLLFYPRNFDLLYPFLYVVAAVGIIRFLDRIDPPMSRWWVRCSTAALFFIYMQAGAVQAIEDARHPLDPMIRARMDCRTLAAAKARDLKPGETIRGNGICDGVALYCLSRYARFNPDAYPVQTVYLFSNSYQDALEFCKQNIPARLHIAPKPIAREGAVVIYRLKAKA